MEAVSLVSNFSYSVVTTTAYHDVVSGVVFLYLRPASFIPERITQKMSSDVYNYSEYIYYWVLQEGGVATPFFFSYVVGWRGNVVQLSTKEERHGGWQ